MSSENITIKIKTLDSKELILTVPKNLPVPQLKEKVAQRSSIPAIRQRIICQGRVLKDDKCLSDYGIENNQVLHLVAMPQQESSSNERTQQPTSTRTHTSTTTPIGGVYMSTISVPDGSSLPDLNSIVSNVLNSMTSSTFGTTSSINEGEQRPREQRSRVFVQRQPQVFVQQSTNVSSIADMISRLQQLFGDNNNRLTRLATLLRRESSLTNQERQEAQTLCNQLSPIISNLRQLTDRLSPMISNLQMGSQSGQARTTSVTTRTPVSGIQLHLHVNANELDRLPEQLDRVQQMVDLRPRTFRGEGQATIAIVSETTPAPTSVQTQQQTQQQTTQQQQQTQRNQQSTGSTQQPLNLQNLFGQRTSGSVNIGQMMSSLFGSQNNQQQRNPLESVLQYVRNTVAQSQSGQQTSLRTVIGNVANTLGIQDSEPSSTIDSLLQTMLENLDVSDILEIMNGNWGCLERVKDSTSKHVREKILNNDTSKENRSAVIEKMMDATEKALLESQELKTEIQNRVKPGRDLITEIVEVCRTYSTMLIDIIVDGVEEYRQQLGISTNCNTPFSESLKKMTTLFLGELVLTIVDCCKNQEQDAEAILDAALKKTLSSFNTGQFNFILNMGAGMAVQYVMGRYRAFKQEYPDRKPTRTPKPKIYKKEKEKEQAKSDEKETSKSEEKPEKILETIDMDETLLDSIVNEVSQTSTTNEQPNNQSKMSKKEEEEELNSEWKKNLSNETIKEIEETLKKDEDTMKNANKIQTLSAAYAKGNLDNTANTGSGQRATLQETKDGEPNSDRKAETAKINSDGLD